jgi:hypothetical protein
LETADSRRFVNLGTAEGGARVRVNGRFSNPG